MDAITLILAALNAGVTAGTQVAASEAIKDAYHGLKERIQRRFAGKSSAELALDEHENDPETWEAPLRKALVQADADKDQGIIQAAQNVMTLIRPQQAALGKYNVQITGNVQGYAQGDNQQVTMNFGDDPKEK